MKPKIMILMALLALVLVAPALAVNMTIAEMGFSGPQTIQIYTANGTLLGTYNTTANGIDLPDSDFLLVIKPEISARYAQPGNILTDGLAFVMDNVIALMVIVFLIVLWLGRR